MERHRTDFLSLVFGALFAGTAAAVLLGVPLTVLWSRETLPVLLILLGIWVLATLGRGDPGRRTRADGEQPDGEQPGSGQPDGERRGEEDASDRLGDDRTAER